MSSGPNGAAGRPRAPLPSGQPPRPRRAHPARGRRTATAPAQALRPKPGPEATGSHPDGPHPDVAAPSWDEADSFRETTLQKFDHPEQREAVRAFGRVLYDLGTETTRDPGDESTTRAELRAVAADLRYIRGYLLNVIRRSTELCSLGAADDKLARSAGRLARRVGALIESIDEQLS
jgi:hypothetical protein